MSNPNHYVCIHGHFYQPPRENPWLGVIEPQPGAAPFHDWNERIAAECYTACARARIHDQHRLIDRLANNFLNISFNIGPTLFSWLESHHPNTTKRIIEADRKSVERLNGHGNALAQVYNHMIMPLASKRDRQTQIMWGLEDFKHRFKRDAEGMWLAECAVDTKTVTDLIDHGIKFIILAPTQASKFRHFNDEHWREVIHEPLDTRHPYRIYDIDKDGKKDHSRYLDVFFYNGRISNAIAFEKLLQSAGKMSNYFEQEFDVDAQLPQLVSAATDGESYGHHEPYGEMCLAYFYEELVKKQGQPITNYAHFLSICEPGVEVELYMGGRGEGSSWSCSHGVDRWYRHCGCSDGGEANWSQEWRTVLRETFDDVRRVFDDIFEREGGKVFLDHWKARDAYISVILDRSENNRQEFLKKHAPSALEDKKLAEHVWILLEMQHNAMLMYTSCGWFFADIAGVEPVQNMRYALRAVEYASNFTDEDLEARLVSGLERTASNDPKHGSGGHIFRKCVRKSVYSLEKIAACFVLMEMYGLPKPPFKYRLEHLDTDTSLPGWSKSMAGVIMFEDYNVHVKRPYAYVAAHISDKEAGCIMKAFESVEDARAALAEWKELPSKQLGALISEDGFLIRDMPSEQRGILLEHVLSSRLQEVNMTFGDTYDDLKPLLAILSENEIEAPEVIRVSSQFVLNRRFVDVCRTIAKSGRWDSSAESKAKALLEEADLYNMNIDRTPASPIMADLVLAYMDRLVDKLELSVIQEVGELIRFSRQMGLFFENGGKIENRYWYILRKDIVPAVKKIRSGDIAEGSEEFRDADELIKRVYALGRELKFSETHLDNLLSFVEHTEPDEGIA